MFHSKHWVAHHSNALINVNGSINIMKYPCHCLKPFFLSPRISKHQAPHKTVLFKRYEYSLFIQRIFCHLLEFEPPTLGITSWCATNWAILLGCLRICYTIHGGCDRPCLMFVGEKTIMFIVVLTSHVGRWADLSCWSLKSECGTETEV